MKIGLVEIKNNTIFAPLAGITHLPLRLLAKAEGCGLVCSEMISAKGLVYGSEKTAKMLESHPDEKPFSVQLFGAEPGVMAEAARMVEASGADILDINFGCSVKKVIKTGSGAALMKAPVLAAEILNAVRKSISIPLTIKIRSGWNPTGDQAVMIARIAEESGVDALTIHPRSATQGFSGHADWALIKRIKTSIDLPVIGNGDIVIAQDALRMQAETGCDAVMVGRAAFGNPWIFSQIHDLMAGNAPSEVPVRKRFETLIRYVETAFLHLGESQAGYMMRSRLGWFVKGLPFGAKFREAVKSIDSKERALDLIQEFWEMVENASRETLPVTAVRRLAD